jgi:hypothetical protein
MTSSTETYFDNWNKLMSNELTDPERAVLVEFMAESMNTAVSGNADARIDVMDALGAIFDTKPYDDQMWGAVEAALTLSLDEWAPRLIGWLVVNQDIPPRLAEVGPSLSPAALALIRGLLARHGSDLERAFYLSGGFIDDWRTLWSSLRLDPSTNQYRILLRIQKYNGEDMLIESRPDAMLTLATQLLSNLNAVPGAGAFSQNSEPFLSQANQLVKTLTPIPAETQTLATPTSPDSTASASDTSETQVEPEH